MSERRTTLHVEGVPTGWTVEYVASRGYDSPDYTLEARHVDYPYVSAGCSRAVSDEDYRRLLSRIAAAECPKITHAQWRNVGRREGWL